jgi:hypothetical protein
MTTNWPTHRRKARERRQRRQQRRFLYPADKPNANGKSRAGGGAA